MAEKGENSYGNILKRISAFGGVQVFNILINIARGKFVALFLGPAGMGISQLLTSSTNTIQQLSSLGLNLSIVKETASRKDDSESLPHAMATARRLILLTSALGAALCLILSPLLSLWTFGDYSYTLSFVALSVMVALMVAANGHLALLQGMGEVKRLSKASLAGGLAGLFCGVPLYYFFGADGIVPAMIILALAIFLFYYISFRKSVKADSIKFSWSSHKPIVKKLVSLGLVLMVGSLVGTFTNYAINIFVRAYGSEEMVGLFQSANSITNQYVGVIFSALALDYFPRLSSVSHDTRKLCEVVNRQAEIVILIVTPLVLLLMLTAPLVIQILLTDSFLEVTPLMRWLGFGVLVQSVSFPMGYILIAKDNRKVYIWLEVVFSNLMWIACSMGFFYLYSLIGLGISLVVRASIDVAVTYCVCRKAYGFRITGKTASIVAISLLLGAFGFASTFIGGNFPYYFLPAIIAMSATYSFIRLRKGVRTTESIQED